MHSTTMIKGALWALLASLFGCALLASMTSQAYAQQANLQVLADVKGTCAKNIYVEVPEENGNVFIQPVFASIEFARHRCFVIVSTIQGELPPARGTYLGFFQQAFGIDCQTGSTIDLPQSPGGYMHRYILAAFEVRERGCKVRISGICASACVIFADLARNNVCITKDANFRVHKETIFPNDTPLFGVIKMDQPQSRDIDREVIKLGGYPDSNQFEDMRQIPFPIAKNFWRVCNST